MKTITYFPTIFKGVGSLDVCIQRRAGATKLGGKAEEVHQGVLAKIHEFFPELTRTCFKKFMLGTAGCLLIDEENIVHPMINPLVADMITTGIFNHFYEFNLKKGIKTKPQDYLANIIAHEYGCYV